MKNLFLSALFLSLLSFSTTAQTGKVFENLTVKSDILKMERKFSIYLPPGYETSEREYPVLYLLHGAGDAHFGIFTNATPNQIHQPQLSRTFYRGGAFAGWLQKGIIKPWKPVTMPRAALVTCPFC